MKVVVMTPLCGVVVVDIEQTSEALALARSLNLVLADRKGLAFTAVTEAEVQIVTPVIFLAEQPEQLSWRDLPLPPREAPKKKKPQENTDEGEVGDAP